MQWEYAQARLVWVNCEQSLFLQFRGHRAQGIDDLAADHIRTDTLGADLNHAGRAAMGHRQDRTKVEVMGEYHITVGFGESHDLRIRRIPRPEGRSVRRFDDEFRPQAPAWRQVHVDEQLHTLASSILRSSARHET